MRPMIEGTSHKRCRGKLVPKPTHRAGCPALHNHIVNSYFFAAVSQILRKKNIGGFSLVELMIVIAIISIIAGIALPHFMRHRMGAFNSAAESSAKNAFIAAQARFNDNPTDDINSIDTLKASGYRETDDVTVNVTGNLDTLVISAYHGSGNKTYTISAEGIFTW